VEKGKMEYDLEDEKGKFSGSGCFYEPCKKGG